VTLDFTAVDLTTEELRTARLLLRPPRPDDEEAVFLACQAPEVLRWTVSLPDPYTRADARVWVRGIAPGERAEGRGLPCVVEADGALVGSAGLTAVC
jgi:RimJ/RimL family protein N-acetyltransferase